MQKVNENLKLLRNKKSVISTYLNIFVILLIYCSISLLVIDIRYPEFSSNNNNLISIINDVILVLFTFEIFFRMFLEGRGIRYIKSFDGVIDVVAVAPGLIAFFFPGVISLTWLRVFRLFRIVRFIRIVKITKKDKDKDGVFEWAIQKLFPWVALAAGLKGIILSAEVNQWWPDVGDLSIIITIAGFSISIVLGAKLTIVQSRFYDVEDTICRILGAVTDMKKDDRTYPALISWFEYFKIAILSGEREKIKKIKDKTFELEKVLEEENVGGPVTVSFHKDVEFLVHRIRTKTPPFIDQFLKMVTIVYSGIAVIAIPGFTGFLMVLLIVFFLGGMYFLIDDLENPLFDKERPLMSIDFTPICEYKI